MAAASAPRRRLRCLVGHLLWGRARHEDLGCSDADAGDVAVPVGVAATQSPVRVAIVGAGVGGSHAAYWLKQLAADRGVALVLDVYERKGRAGGRALAEHVLDSNRLVEVGASMMIKQNEYMLQAARRSNLEVRFHGPKPGEPSRMAIWDGAVMRFVGSSSKAATLGRLLYRYGPLQFHRVLSIARRFIANFHKIYELQERGISFESAEAFWGALDMGSAATGPGGSALQAALGSGAERLLDELVGGLIRNNYNATPSEATELTCMTAVAPFAAGGSAAAWSVGGGNQRIAEELLSEAGAHVHLRAKVQHVTPRTNGQIRVEFIQSTQENHPPFAADDTAPQSTGPPPSHDATYDAVIVATPCSFDAKTLQLTVGGEQAPHCRTLSHRLVHVTFAAGRLSEAHFGLPSAQLDQLRDIFVPVSTKTRYNSIGRCGEQADGTPIYKFFSTVELRDEDLAPLFQGGAPATRRYLWRAYPERAESLPPLVLAPGLFSCSAVEYATSAMEVMAASGRNVALLAANHLGFGPSVLASSEQRPQTKAASQPTARVHPA